MVLTWGIVGAGLISTNFVKAISTLSNGEHQVYAVASQNLERAQKLANDLHITKAYGTYHELANDKKIDVVYIGNLNTQHLETSKLMLASGKHVLCEKPMTLNEAQTRELINFAKERKLFLMEAMWSRCFPVYDKLRNLIDSDAIGEVMHVTVQFGVVFDTLERIASKALGGGTILDLGVYTLQFVQFAYKGLSPINIVAKGTLNENGVDVSSSAIISYKNGKIGIVSTHSKINLTNEARIVGTKGIIKVPLFSCPDTIITPTETIKFELPKSDVNFTYPQFSGLTYEILEVGRCIKTGLLESPKMTHADSLELAQSMDKMRADVGVIFDQDKQL
ncbi:hypothetical protein RI129_003977 [Pyrocoelia pectoralis]|uniref:Trans-1,2-dihydrobenzene-1,2-diol dehydrogenase n=1 Tax=Pyrocoelia pectoralis TaxID=417401 RepID=A0AAN7ZJ27_9COLE